MARLPRIDLAGVPQHVIQRGNNRSACFFSEADYAFYLECMGKAAVKYECAVHAYVLMTNHVHILLTPGRAGSVAHLMQSIGRSYVRYINNRYKRTGTLWEGRYKSCLIDSERYLLTCCRYIERNPVRAGMVPYAEDYRWSSYAVHAQGLPSDLIVAHPLYLGLGKNNEERMQAYKALFDRRMEDATDLKILRVETNRCGVAGSERFKDEMETALARRLRPGKAGRRWKRGGGEAGATELMLL